MKILLKWVIPSQFPNPPDLCCTHYFYYCHAHCSFLYAEETWFFLHSCDVERVNPLPTDLHPTKLSKQLLYHFKREDNGCAFSLLLHNSTLWTLWLPLQGSQSYSYKSARNLKGKQPNKQKRTHLISWLEAKSFRERILVYKHCFDVWNKQYGWQDIFFFFKKRCICLHVYAPHLYYIFKRPEESIGSPGSEVTDGCELPYVCLVLKAGLSGRVQYSFNYQAITPVLHDTIYDTYFYWSVLQSYYNQFKYLF